MRNRSQSILEYAVILGVVITALLAMSLYFRRGIQSVIKVAADEAGDQEYAEEIDPFKGVKVSSLIGRQSRSTQVNKALSGGSRISEIDMTVDASGNSTSVSIQEK